MIKPLRHGPHVSPASHPADPGLDSPAPAMGPSVPVAPGVRPLPGCLIRFAAVQPGRRPVDRCLP
ncbi:MULTISPECIES: hypothetical protein [Streptomyces]|uniref:Uncharacterized protein n=1 Tax=Streptomyces bobili TaxID=67280 RepID=A0ABZ1R891_9ACTN|nr:MULTISPECIES: hypothetical protein [Streptomyces]